MKNDPEVRSAIASIVVAAILVGLAIAFLPLLGRIGSVPLNTAALLWAGVLLGLVAHHWNSAGLALLTALIFVGGYLSLFFKHAMAAESGRSLGGLWLLPIGAVALLYAGAYLGWRIKRGRSRD